MSLVQPYFAVLCPMPRIPSHSLLRMGTFWVCRTFPLAVDPLGFFKEAKDFTVSPTTKGSCERCGEDVLDTQNRDKTESGNYVHLLPDHCPVLAKEANWKHRQTTFEEEIEDATQV